MGFEGGVEGIIGEGYMEDVKKGGRAIKAEDNEGNQQFTYVHKLTPWRPDLGISGSDSTRPSRYIFRADV